MAGRLIPRILGGGAFVAAGLAAADITVNDEWDNVRNRFRRKLSSEEQGKRPHIVVLGTGWAACSFIRKLETDKFNVTVVSPRNHFMYTPLLCGTTVGTVEPRSIVEPIRTLCARSQSEGVKFVQAECTGVDTEKSVISCRGSSPAVDSKLAPVEIAYDHLVVAVGAQPNTFGTPGVMENGMFLKEVRDSQKIRDRVNDLLEAAALPGQTPEAIRKLLHFVVVGAGPTGIEFAAELHDFLKRDIPVAFPDLDIKDMKITIFEALPHVLGAFDSKLREYTEEHFRREQIDIRKNTMVTAVSPDLVTAKARGGSGGNNGEEHIPYGLLVWVAGLGTRPLVQQLAASLPAEEQNSRRGLVVDDHLRVKGLQGSRKSSIFAMGDCAFSGSPPTAQVASQQGTYLARMFNSLAYSDETGKLDSSVLDTKEAAPFLYQHRGAFAYVGDNKAVAQFPSSSVTNEMHMTGEATYTAWRAVYWSKLLSTKNRCLVAFDWAKTAMFGRDSSRT